MKVDGTRLRKKKKSKYFDSIWKITFINKITYYVRKNGLKDDAEILRMLKVNFAGHVS